MEELFLSELTRTEILSHQESHPTAILFHLKPTILLDPMVALVLTDNQCLLHLYHLHTSQPRSREFLLNFFSHQSRNQQSLRNPRSPL
jgi:hypothetical protein